MPADVHPPPRSSADRSAVLIPIKSFDLAKGRLADAVAPAQRSVLARQMAARVIRAAGPLPVWVVCGDHAVADFARSEGAHVIWRSPKGLNRAVADGTEDLALRGVTRAVIAHADLPLAVDLSHLAPAHSEDTRHDRVLLVPDRRNDGTNVLSIPLGRGFEFHYGPDSFAAHRAEALRCRLPMEIVRDERLGWDVDIPEDLAVLEGAAFERGELDDPPRDHPLSDSLEDSP